ncbi:MAG: bifunctional enoyl-CoA hydratase/phosphate acetyltransferase, partial [Pseudomonadota bacterium]
LGGALQAMDCQMIKPILIGIRSKIAQSASTISYPLEKLDIIDAASEVEAAQIAVDLVHSNKAKAIMKGSLHTDNLLRPIVAKTGLRTNRRISHVFMMAVPNYPTPLLITDAAINIAPDLKIKSDIIQNAVDLFNLLDFGPAKVAIVSATEMIDPNIETTIEAAALCKMAERGQIVDAILEGPLSFDCAVSAEAAEAKKIKNPVAGQANIIHVPNIESGNIVYKQMSYLSNIESAGIVLGAKVPIILTSRAANAGITRICSCALAQILASG